MHGAGRAWIAVVAVVMAALPAAADHECYKIKDSAAAVTYTADLAGLAAEPGCTIRVPAKLLCVDTTESNVHPAPPGGGPVIQDAGPFLCYAVKCKKTALPPVAVADQFGQRTVTPRKTGLLCAPAAFPTTTTTTRPLSACTTTLVPFCGTGPGFTCPPAPGFCPGGQTCETNPDGCSCVGPPPACGNAGPAFCSAGTCPAGQTCQTICQTDGNRVCECR